MWTDKGVCFIKTILNENGMFMLLKKFKEMYGINTDYIIYIGCVHRILATNIVFMHMGQENDINCSFCRQERDSINYIFWRCVYINSFWEQFQTALNIGISKAMTVRLNKNVLHFGHHSYFKSDTTFDWIILRARFYIYHVRLTRTYLSCTF